MNEAAPSNTSSNTSDPDASITPRLHPAPGRCIIRIVPRLGFDPTKQFGESALKTEGGIVAALDGRYKSQPMLGELVSIGDPTTDREKVIADWAIGQMESGHLFVFSQYGDGLPYWDSDMEKMVAFGFDFRWLQGYRLFDIGQLATAVSGTGTYGEMVKSTATHADLVLVSH